jgi:hypothetical protein
VKILALDLSTHAGYALMEGEPGLRPTLIKHGTIDLGKKPTQFGPYPLCFVKAADHIVKRLMEEVVLPSTPDVIVVEETNPGRNRYSQKILEYIHYSFVSWVCESLDLGYHPGVVYLDTGSWRRTLGLKMNPEQKRANAKLSRAKSKAKSDGAQLDKKTLGIKGRITLKHLAVNLVNEQYGLSLKLKDNNDADAICLGLAFCGGASPCTGV